MKNRVFGALAFCLLALSFSFVGCDTGTGGGGSSGSQINRPEPSNYYPNGNGYISLYGKFAPNYGNSVLPGFADILTPLKLEACGFSVATTSGLALTVTKVTIYRENDITIDVNRPLASGEELTISYVPDGVHIFKDIDGNVLNGFSGLTVTYIKK